MTETTTKTVIAFDFGTNSIGCAVGQSITGTAQGLTTFKAQDGIPNWEEIGKLLQDWKPDMLVVGLPLNMDGTEQPLTQRARKFANRLNGRFNLPVELQDERLTTVEAKAEIFFSWWLQSIKKG
ncbi:Putative Holliday junction resolvase [Mannheimia haemolytica]|nr:Putative Holliday junction resolvase [Mannheimia haemolytica]